MVGAQAVMHTYNFYFSCFSDVYVWDVVAELCPSNLEGGGYIVFGADPVGVGVRFFISMHYLLNQLMDFDPTCIDTLLGGGE